MDGIKLIMTEIPEFTLLCRAEKLRKPTFLSLLLLSAEEKKALYEPDLIFPERVLFECYSKLLSGKAKFTVKAIPSSQLDADDVFSEYPVCVFRDQIIRKHNIASFLQQMTTIDDKFIP